MDIHRLGAEISDERCGLYFLAGLDMRPGRKRTATLTVHAARGVLTEENQAAIRSAVAAHDRQIGLRISLHSADEIYAPRSLECLARRFRHRQIVIDPTGTFGRVEKLLALAADIRSEFGSSVSRILWQADSAALVVVADLRQADLDGMRARLESLVGRSVCDDLRRAMRCVRLCAEIPAGRYMPVDAASVPVRAAGLKMAGTFLRASGLAALVGFGSLSAVAAHPFGDARDESRQTPGVAALASLTTLGENAYGTRNRYQALGGLRLYFGAPGGEAGVMSSARMAPPAAHLGVDPVVEPGLDVPSGEKAAGQPQDEPVRIAYD